MAKKKSENESSMELATDIADNLNKTFKDGKIAYIIGSEESPTDLTDFVSTGSSTLDLAISNRPHGGIACGRITELTGLESTGKSLIAAHMMVNVQKENGVVVLLDTENAVNPAFYNAIGLDFTRMVYAQPDTVEDIFVCIEKIIETVRKTENNDKKILIVVDSVSAASTKQEMEADYDKDGYSTGKAIIIGKAMRKITPLIAKQKVALVFTNQLRQKMNAMAFSDKYTTSGGMAIAYHASTRIRLSNIGKIVTKDKKVIGMEVEAKVIKNRLGPPLRTARFEIYFDRGIDDLASWYEFLKEKEIITVKSGGSAEYTDSTGKSHPFKSSDWVGFVESSGFKDEIYDHMCRVMIMSYSSNGLTADDKSTEEGEE